MPTRRAAAAMDDPAIADTFCRSPKNMTQICDFLNIIHDSPVHKQILAAIVQTAHYGKRFLKDRYSIDPRIRTPDGKLSPDFRDEFKGVVDEFLDSKKGGNIFFPDIMPLYPGWRDSYLPDRLEWKRSGHQHKIRRGIQLLFENIKENPDTLKSFDLDGLVVFQSFTEHGDCDNCGSGEISEGDEIVYCDTCNLGYHQSCCGLNPVPEGDWHCQNCRKIKEENTEEQNTKKRSTKKRSVKKRQATRSIPPSPSLSPVKEEGKPAASARKSKKQKVRKPVERGQPSSLNIPSPISPILSNAERSIKTLGQFQIPRSLESPIDLGRDSSNHVNPRAPGNGKETFRGSAEIRNNPLSRGLETSLLRHARIPNLINDNRPPPRMNNDNQVSHASPMRFTSDGSKMFTRSQITIQAQTRPGGYEPQDLRKNNGKSFPHASPMGPTIRNRSMSSMSQAAPPQNQAYYEAYDTNMGSLSQTHPQSPVAVVVDPRDPGTKFQENFTTQASQGLKVSTSVETSSNPFAANPTSHRGFQPEVSQLNTGRVALAAAMSPRLPSSSSQPDTGRAASVVTKSSQSPSSSSRTATTPKADRNNAVAVEFVRLGISKSSSLNAPLTQQSSKISLSSNLGIQDRSGLASAHSSRSPAGHSPAKRAEMAAPEQAAYRPQVYPGRQHGMNAPLQVGPRLPQIPQYTDAPAPSNVNYSPTAIDIAVKSVQARNPNPARLGPQSSVEHITSATANTISATSNLEAIPNIPFKAPAPPEAASFSLINHTGSSNLPANFQAPRNNYKRAIENRTPLLTPQQTMNTTLMVRLKAKVHRFIQLREEVRTVFPDLAQLCASIWPEKFPDCKGVARVLIGLPDGSYGFREISSMLDFVSFEETAKMKWDVEGTKQVWMTVCLLADGEDEEGL